VSHTLGRASPAKGVWTNGWCHNWKQLPDQNQNGYDATHGRTYFHKPVSADDCAAKCVAHPKCTQAVYEATGPWGQECWLGGQVSDKVHRGSRGVGNRSPNAVDHCFHPTPVQTSV
jgi:hypothetical protein